MSRNNLLGKGYFLKTFSLTQFLLFLISVGIGNFPFIQANASIQAELRFEILIQGPSIVEHCAENLWVYSSGERQLWKIDPGHGGIQTKIPISKIGISGIVSAMGCKKETLLISSFVKNPTQVFLHSFLNLLDENTMRKSLKSYSLSGKDFVRDISCYSQSCYLIRKEIFKSQNLKNWSIVNVRKSGDIPPPSSQKTDRPFKYWQDYFLTAKGTYFRVIALSNDSLLLLDPIRGSFVTLNSQQVEKWEVWGFREGNVLFPKSFGGMDNNTLVVSDVGFKLLSIFDRQGKYLGNFGSDGKTNRFGYPLDIAIINDMVYVADFLKNKLFAFRVQIHDTVKVYKNKIQIQENLFRHPDVLKNFSEIRCLHCHDGLEAYNLERFLVDATKKNHPVQVEVKEKIKLPLWNGNKVECFSCHQPHHEAPHGKVTSQEGIVTTVKQLPFQLRLSLPELCVTCHKEKGSKDENHILIKKERLKVKAKQVVSCSQCHKMHQSHEKLLKKGSIDTCVMCHTASQIPQSHPLTLTGEKKVTCISCHTTHGAKKSTHFAKQWGKNIKETCLYCHENRKPRMDLIKHLKVDPKVDKKKWPGTEVVCLRCHHPHEKKLIPTHLCLSCHKDRRQAHHAKNVHALYKKAKLPLPKNIVLENGKLSCITCHDPHDLANQEKYIRFQKEEIQTTCTIFCHGPEAIEDRFKNYHKKQKINKGY